MSDAAPWAVVCEEHPELAEQVEARLGARRHHVLATHRSDGSIRLSGIEVQRHDGALWMGMIAGSTKAADLARDPRFALHSQPDDGMQAGDVKLWGRVVELTPDELDRYRTLVGPPEPMVAYRLELEGVARVALAPNGTEIEVSCWRAGIGPVVGP